MNPRCGDRSRVDLPPRGHAWAQGSTTPMFVAVSRIVWRIPGNDSLKGKRRIVRRIIDRTRARFNAAVAEVDALDDHRQAVIAFAVVSNDGRHASSMLDKIRDFTASLTEAVVVDVQTELLPLGELHGAASELWQSDDPEWAS